MSRVGDQLTSLAPALAFLLAGVPLAALLERLGFFSSAAAVLGGRRGRDTPVLGLWVLACVTTVVLNLDTTVVLLTPLYLRLARRSDVDPLPVVAIPLLLASLASSVLPVSNLTTLIVVDRLHLGVGAVFAHLALPSLLAVTVGWFAYRRRFPTRLPAGAELPVDRRALRIGGIVVAAILVGFVVGPSFGIDPWMTAVAADVVLVIITRVLPWRSVPVLTAAGVAVVAALAALIVPQHALTGFLHHPAPLAVVGAGAVGAAAANVVNNLPALLLALDGVHRMTWGMWAWLLGVNAGAVLLPIGALANLLWLRILRADGLRLGFRRYVGVTVPIALPALVAALLTLGLERLVTR
ncbi:MAG: Citrate transporter [Actinomycetia bacterium]|nr:Citrate transporter [Actinomycetes bacterium]